MFSFPLFLKYCQLSSNLEIFKVQSNFIVKEANQKAWNPPFHFEMFKYVRVRKVKHAAHSIHIFLSFQGSLQMLQKNSKHQSDQRLQVAFQDFQACSCTGFPIAANPHLQFPTHLKILKDPQRSPRDSGEVLVVVAFLADFQALYKAVQYLCGYSAVSDK